MGTKFSTTCDGIARISSALRSGSGPLSEAKKKKKFKGPKGPGRKAKKQQRNQDALYSGSRAAPGKVGADNPLTMPPMRGGSTSTSPPQTPSAPMAAPKRPMKLPVVKIQTPSSVIPQPEEPQPIKVLSDPKERRPAPMPRRFGPSTPPSTKTSFLTKIGLGGRKKPAARGGASATPGRFNRVKAGIERARGIVKKIAGFFSRKKRLEDDFAPRTSLLISRLNEQRSSTTFKKCPKGAMLSSPGLRHSLPQNMFVKPDEKNPTYPIRPGCRASMGGVARAAQDDMGNADEAVMKQLMQRVNQMGGTRGKQRLRLWGTGKGGRRMNTFRGKSGTPLRTKTLAKRLGISKKKAAALHGVSTGKADNQKHTSPYSPPGGSKGPAGNREVTRAKGAHKMGKKKISNRKQKRQAAQRSGTIGRGRAKIGR